MLIDSTDSSELQKALGDAAGKASILWTTFITFELYMTIAFGSVTHRDLFLDTPIKLPVLNVELPLVGFFVVAPTLLVIFHFYVFLQLIALAKKASAYNTLLIQAAPMKSDREYLRQRLDSFVVLQILAGPEQQRVGFCGFSLRLISWLTLVGAPVLVLLQGQVTFLPYHQWWVMWLQRAAILVDLLVIWYFWIRLRTDEERMLGRWSSKASTLIGIFASIGVLLFGFVLATFPGEWLNDHLPNVRLFPVGFPWSQTTLTSLQELLFEGPVDEVSGRPRSLFSNRLVLTDQTFVDADKLDKAEFSRSFRGRDLRRAVFNRADLRKVDFTGGMLSGASFVGAKLQRAHFDCASRGATDRISIEEDTESDKWPDDGCTWLTRASFEHAQLQGSSFERARLQQAGFEEAELQGASFEAAQMQDSSLVRAQLGGASFRFAHLQGASLSDTQSQQARFEGADMRGASLEGAHLQGASFLSSHLQAASFQMAKLQGASFKKADLQGATLIGAQLQGASLEEADMAGASLGDITIWRTRGTPLTISLATLFSPDTNKMPWKESGASTSTFSAWRESILKATPAGKDRDELSVRLSILDPAIKKTRDDLISEKFWKDAVAVREREKRDRDGENEREKEFVAFITDLACSDDSPPYAARGLIERVVGDHSSIFGDRLRKSQADPASCPGVKGFSNQDWRKLEDYAPDLEPWLSGPLQADGQYYYLIPR